MSSQLTQVHGTVSKSKGTSSNLFSMTPSQPTLQAGHPLRFSIASLAQALYWQQRPLLLTHKATLSFLEPTAILCLLSLTVWKKDKLPWHWQEQLLTSWADRRKDNEEISLSTLSVYLLFTGSLVGLSLETPEITDWQSLGSLGREEMQEQSVPLDRTSNPTKSISGTKIVHYFPPKFL